MVMKRLICAALLSGALLARQGAALAASDVADAVMQGDAARLQTLLKAHADVNAAQPDGSTALHWAAYHGDARTAAALLAAGAHPNVAMDTGVTPLVRVGVQSAIAHPQTAALLRRLMEERGLPVPPEGRTLASICVTPDLCR
jgi:ankyrin repeat protein